MEDCNEEGHSIVVEDPFPASLLELFEGSDDEDSKEQVQSSSAPPVVGTTSDTVNSTIQNLVVNKCTILQANSFNYHSFLQGRAMERITPSICCFLRYVFNNTEVDVETLYIRCKTFFKTEEEQKDAQYIENQLRYLIERIVLWKTKLSENSNKNDGTKSTASLSSIPVVIIKRPVLERRRRRFVGNVDEIARIKKARAQQLATIQKFRPATVPTLVIEEENAEERRKNAIEKRLQKEAERYMLNNSLSDDFLTWDEESPQTSSSAAADPQITLKSDFDNATEEIMNNISRFTAAISEAHSSIHQPSSTSISNSALPQRRGSSDVYSSSIFSRRQQLRQQMGAYINFLPPPQTINHVTKNNTSVLRKRAQNNFQARDIIAKRNRSIVNRYRDMSSNSWRVQRVPDKSANDHETESSDNGENDSDVCYVDNEIYEGQEDVQDNTFNVRDSTNFRFSTKKLKSCLRKVSYFVLPNQEKHRKSIRINTIPQVEYIEIVNPNASFLSTTNENNVKKNAPKTQMFTIPTPKLEISNQTNIVRLPHTDQPSVITKRTDPKLMGESGLRELYEELTVIVDDFYFATKSNQSASRWIICDTLLKELDDRVLKNTFLTRIEFPKLSKWLVTEGLKNYTENFPRQITRIFIACGYDIELFYADEQTLIHFEFIRDLLCWFHDHAARGRVSYTQDDMRLSVGRQMPLIVAINIPEIGHFSRMFKQFNERFAKYIDGLNERYEVKRYNKIQLLDWAALVRDHPDQEEMKTNEGRMRVLVEEMKNDYGVIYR